MSANEGEGRWRRTRQDINANSTLFERDAGHLSYDGAVTYLNALESRLAEAEAWGKQIHDALDGNDLPTAPDEAPSRIRSLRVALAEAEARANALSEASSIAEAGRLRAEAKAALADEAASRMKGEGGFDPLYSAEWNYGWERAELEPWAATGWLARYDALTAKQGEEHTDDAG